MDVNRTGFDGRLLEILEAISTAHFVSLDLELTGIPTRPYGKRNKHTLQQRYEEVKKAAEIFQVLQVGLTCAEEDDAGESYLLRSYNFNISPHPTEDIDFSRIYSCDSDALRFLSSNGFDFTEPLRSGVPYLSYDEEKLAKQRFRERQERTYEDIDLAPDDSDTLEFFDRIRREVRAWQSPKNAAADGEDQRQDTLFIVS